MCRDWKSGNRCIYGNNCLYRHADGEEKPSKKSKKESTQGAVAILKEKIPRLCISEFRSKEVYSAEAGQTRLNASARHTIKFSGRTLCEIQIRERKKGHLEVLSKKVKPMSEILARPSWRKERLRRNLKTRRVCRKAAWDLARKIAVLSLGKLCSEHGCSNEWKNGETPRLTKNGKTITCIKNNFVPLVVPGLSSFSSSSSASTSRPKDQSNSFDKSETSSAGNRCRQILTS